MVDKIDHSEIAIGRLVTQFKEAKNLISYIRNIISESQELENVFHDILDKRWIDTSEGIQLDILGEIVGQPRILIDGNIFTYFGFDTNPSSDSFGTLSDSSIGSSFASIGTVLIGNRSLSDDEYRLFIRAKIIKNKSRSTPEDIISQLQYLFNTPQILFTDGNTEYSVDIGRKLSPNDKSLLFNTDIVSKTIGVKVNYVVSYDYDKFFGFEGIPNSSGFGSTASPDIGGFFGKLI